MDDFGLKYRADRDFGRLPTRPAIRVSDEPPVYWRFKARLSRRDFWIGIHWNAGDRQLIVCPFPCVVLSWSFSSSLICECCGRRPAMNEPRVTWGRMHPNIEDKRTPNRVGMYCRNCGGPDSDAGK